MKLKLKTRKLIYNSARPFFCCLLIAFSSVVYGLPLEQPKKINVLAFWGYLDNPNIKKSIESTCKVQFSHDSYYTNEEFLETFNNHSSDYDVIIFSNLAYGNIKNKIADNQTDLWKVSLNYYPYFKKYYLEHHYPHNVVFFTHALMGFMYNPNIINILPNQNIFEIFKNAGNNDVVLVDDPAEINNLLTLGDKTSKNFSNKNSNIKINYTNLKKVTQNSKLFITSDFNQIYINESFAFAFLWSGDSLLYINRSNKPYKFVLNRSLSFICTDLLAQIKQTPQAKCVARMLGTPEIMQYVQESTYYFTPYFQNNIDNLQFKELYTETKKMLPYLTWIQPVSDFSEYNIQWNKIKIRNIETSN